MLSVLLLLLTAVAVAGAVYTRRYRENRAWVPTLAIVAASTCYLALVFTMGVVGWQDSLIGAMSGVGPLVHDVCGGPWSLPLDILEIGILAVAFAGPWIGMAVSLLGAHSAIWGKDAWFLKTGIYIFAASIVAAFLSGLMILLWHAIGVCHVVS